MPLLSRLTDPAAEHLTYVLAVHVVKEGEAIGGAVGGGALGVHVESGGQQPGLVSVLPRPRRLNVHVETCHSTITGQLGNVITGESKVVLAVRRLTPVVQR